MAMKKPREALCHHELSIFKCPPLGFKTVSLQSIKIIVVVMVVEDDCKVPNRPVIVGLDGAYCVGRG